VNIFADGVSVRQVGRETFRLCQELVDEMVLVDTDEICAAIKDVFEDARAVDAYRLRAEGQIGGDVRGFASRGNQAQRLQRPRPTPACRIQM